MIPVRILDGGLGTCLESEPYNVHFSTATPLWSSDLLTSSPGTLLEVHKAYVTAGADVILTATYQASFEGFSATPKQTSTSLDSGANELQSARDDDTESDITEEFYNIREASTLMRSAIPLARRAFQVTKKRGQVALSLGAYGATMQPSTEYLGDYKPQQMKTCHGLAQWHKQRLEIFRSDAITWAGVDYVAFETIPVLEEVRAVRQVMGQFNGESHMKNWWISCVFPEEEMHIPDGTSIDGLIQAMLEECGPCNPRPWGIGINCSSVTKVDHLVLQFEKAVKTSLEGSSFKNSDTHEDWPWLVLYPDGAQGLIYNTHSQSWEAKELHDSAQPPVAWYLQVANVVTSIRKRALWQGILVGGCCKTTPDDIAQLRMRLISQGLYTLGELS